MAKNVRLLIVHDIVQVGSYNICFATKEAITTEVSVLGGITLKPPCDKDALTDFLHRNELAFPCGTRTTVYRIEFQGVVYFSKAYQRVKKRNSYTVLYRNDEQEKFGLIEYFLFLHHKIIAVLKLLSPIPVTCKSHFNLSTTVLDTVSFLTPVVKTNPVECCFVKILYVNVCLLISTLFSMSVSFLLLLLLINKSTHHVWFFLSLILFICNYKCIKYMLLLYFNVLVLPFSHCLFLCVRNFAFRKSCVTVMCVRRRNMTLSPLALCIEEKFLWSRYPL